MKHCIKLLQVCFVPTFMYGLFYSQSQVNVYTSTESLCASHVAVTVALPFTAAVLLTYWLP